MDLFAEIKKVIVRVFAVEDDVVSKEAHLQDDLGGDSMAVMNLAEAISTRYDIDLEGEDLLEIENVGELVELVQSKIS